MQEIIPKDGYRIESVTYEAVPGEAIPALLLVPEGASAERPAPAVAVWHQHNGEWHLGKSEPAGLAGNPMHHTGVALVKEGYVVLCPDALCFEERQDPFLKGGDYERFEFLRYVVSGKCLAWRNILDMRRAIDYLVSRPEVQKRSDRLLRTLHGVYVYLAGRPVGLTTAALPGGKLLSAYLYGDPSTQTAALLPNFIPGWYRYADTRRLRPWLARSRSFEFRRQRRW